MRGIRDAQLSYFLPNYRFFENIPLTLIDFHIFAHLKVQT